MTREGEVRAIKRSDLMEVLDAELPAGTIRYGYHLVSVKLDPLTSDPILEFYDGRIIKAKVLFFLSIRTLHFNKLCNK